jgi:hypothetical protein
MEWMSTGARISDWDYMPYNLNPLNRRPGHTHTLGRTALFGGSSIGPSPMRALLGHALSRLGGCCSLSLVGSGILVVLLNKEFLDILEVLEHRTRRLRDCLVRQVVLVPPRNWEV